jgi:hypothetical protein
MVYCIAPGMTQYLVRTALLVCCVARVIWSVQTSDSNVVSWIIFAANFSNMIGRISTGFFSIW